MIKFWFLRFENPCFCFLPSSPDGAHEAGAQREHGDVARFGEGPVVGGEGPRQRALPQSDDEVGAPQKSDGVVDLQVEEVPLEEALLVVIDEDAAGGRAAWIRRGVERLRVAVHCAVDALTAAQRGIQSHHFVDRHS